MSSNEAAPNRIEAAYDCIVVGAGIAGLAAAQSLAKSGVTSLAVFEARDRIGGRILTNEMHGCPLDLGASWIRGSKGNPLLSVPFRLRELAHVEIFTKSNTRIDAARASVLIEKVWTARQRMADARRKISKRKSTVIRLASSPEPSLEDESNIAFQSGGRPSLRTSWWRRVSRQQSLDASSVSQTEQMMEVSDNIVASPEALIREEKLSDEEEVSMRDWLLSDAEFDKDVTGCTEYGDLLIDLVSMLENVEGADLNVISLANDDKNDFTGPHLYVADGLWDLVRVTAGSLLKENRDILKLEHEVVGIDYSGEASTPTHPIHIHTSRGVFACKATIITLPLGILQTSHTRLFHPSLPPKHAQAIESVGVGLMDKVILEFPHPFWDPSLDGFWAFLPAPRIRRGMDFDEGGEAAGLVWFVNLCKMHEKGPPVLIGHVSQRHARRIEEMDDEEVEALFMEMLKACFVGVQVPEPESFRVTRWGMDPFSMGACAYLPVGNGASLANIITLSEPVSSVHFAGEHTSPHHFGTVHGALMSGIVEAESVALELGFLQ